MRLSVIRSDVAFNLLHPASDTGWPWRGGIAVSEPWPTPRLVLDETGADEFIAVDCFELISGADGLILSDFARGALADLLSEAGEFWPVEVFGQSYWWFNCLACVPVLDRKRTDADWSVVEGAWGSFQWITTTRRLAFLKSKLRAIPALFRVPEYPQGVIFATEVLGEAIARHGLTGFRLAEVWSTEDGGVTDPPGVSLGGIFEPINKAEIRRRRALAVAKLQQRRSRPGPVV